LIEEWNIVYFPSFPNPQNAKYEEWKIFFESWIQSIKVQWDIVLIGTSLGGNFLLTYFWEKWVFPYTIKSIHFIAACQKCGDFNPPSSYEFLQKIENQAHIWHAEDDSVVPLSVGQEIAKNLPNAETHFFSSEKWYGHFHAVELFSEIEDTLLR
jgi:predicted alpha/beta-fold hydrolase